MFNMFKIFNSFDMFGSIIKSNEMVGNFIISTTGNYLESTTGNYLVSIQSKYNNIKSKA